MLPPRPLAVLEVINKRGKGIFSKHDEGALVRLCTFVESLLRRKAAEVSLLWSGLTERSLMRKGTAPGGAGSPTNYAQVESTIMRLYSKVQCPPEAVGLGEKRAIMSSAGLRGGGGGDDSDDGSSCDRERSVSDSVCAEVGFGQSSSNSRGVGSVRRRGASDSTVPGKAVAIHGSGGGGRGIDRMFMGETAQEESELVDLGMNLFDPSSDQLLSLVGRFFRNMGLTKLFKVCVCVRVCLWLFFQLAPFFCSRFRRPFLLLGTRCLPALCAIFCVL